MKFSKNLQKFRIEQDLSQEQLAEKIGVSRQSISAWESGKTLPEIDKVAEICKVFEISSSELLGEISKKSGRKFDKKEYSARISKSAIWRAIGIFTLFAGISAAAFFATSNSGIDNSGFAAGISLMIGLAISIPIFTFESEFNKFTISKLEKLNPELEEVFDEDEIEKIGRIKIISSMIFLVFLFGAIAIWQFISWKIGESSTNLANSIFMILIGTGLAFSTFGSAINSQITNFEEIKNAEKNQKSGKFWAILMLSTTLIFLAYSFITNDWVSAKFFYPIAGIGGVIVSIIIDKSEK